MMAQAPTLTRFDIIGDRRSNDAVYARLAHLEETYPGFRSWFFDKVALFSPLEERAIFTKRLKEKVIGVAIAKRSHAERKLCTLWVDPTARASHVAAELGNQTFEWLGTTKPLFTVPEEKIVEFKGLLNRWDFHAEEILMGYYRPNKVEYVFNGRLRAMAHA